MTAQIIQGYFPSFELPERQAEVIDIQKHRSTALNRAFQHYEAHVGREIALSWILMQRDRLLSDERYECGNQQALMPSSHGGVQLSQDSRRPCIGTFRKPAISKCGRRATGIGI